LCVFACAVLYTTPPFLSILNPRALLGHIALQRGFALLLDLTMQKRCPTQ